MIPVTGSRLILQERSEKDPRILQEDIGNNRNRKQYSDRKSIGFFPMNSNHNPVISSGNRWGIYGKKPELFPAGILLPNSSDFQCLPAGSARTVFTWGSRYQ